MISITGNELREKYLKFFGSKQHLIMPSFPLIPQDDPSLLLIGAGMAPLKPYFTGKVVPPSYRVTTCQKCIRTGDIENVGRTARHHTFFEMLGNFSFGNYFKKEAIDWAWEFLTDVLQLDQSKLYVTVYPDDDEAYGYWHDMIGVPEDHISRLEDNFWEIGEGPCGPDSEIFYDLGKERGCGEPDCAVGCDCDRYLEIWNLVFTQFDKDGEGNYNPLEKKNIDTGAGLERLASVLQGKPSNFETDLIFPIIKKMSLIAGVTYGVDKQTDISLKVIGDHIRAITMMIADGVLPSNEGRGYVLRRILRRAVRHGRLLGVEGKFLTGLINDVVITLGAGYPDLEEKQPYVEHVVANEEERFGRTLAQGLELLQSSLEQARQDCRQTMSGEEAFKLYDTFGFPWELTKEIAGEQEIDIDMAGFNSAMEAQRTRARAAREDVDTLAVTPDTTRLNKDSLHDDELATMSSIVLLSKDGIEVNEVVDGDDIVVILETTPFHAEGGGQVGDVGTLKTPMGLIQISNAKKLPNDLTYLLGTVLEGCVRTGDVVTATVDTDNHIAIARNHTGTHLLQAALRQVLGEHVKQAGSLVMADRLRFDFTHFSPVTEPELNLIGNLVNHEILAAKVVHTEKMTMEEAKKSKAMALFGEKYGDIVRVVTIDNFSQELCGGSHVKNTGMLGSFRIISESGIGSGVRRIEAVTGMEALKLAEQDTLELQAIAELLKTKPKTIVEKLMYHLKNEKDLEKELQEQRRTAAAGGIDAILQGRESLSGLAIIVAQVKVNAIEELREMGDRLRDKVQSGVVLLGTVIDDKVNFVCMATKDAVARDIHAGKIVKAAAQEVGGNGGGRPDMAQAGGKFVEKIDQGLLAGKAAISKMIS